jgi:hypothetical protein
VAALEARFAEACWNADLALGEPGAVRYFPNYVDETPREQMIQELLVEVQLELSRRSWSS